MKIIILLITIAWTLALTGQHTTKFNVTLKYSNGVSSPLRLDSVFLISNQQTVNTYINILKADSTFILTNITVGKYWLKFATQQYCVLPIRIVVCSKCDNQFDLFSFSKKPDDNCNVFSSVEISPSYTGGNRVLAKDFQEKLTAAEKESLRSIPDFSIHFFLTKQKIPSDITFIPGDISQEAKNVIVKSLTALIHWNPALLNGRIADEEYIISKRILLND
jgi:hypothetical protein